MANSLNRNARLQQENYLLSIQQERYTNLCNAIEETRQARHDMRHHFLQLSSMAEAGDLEKIKEYLYNVTQKISTMHMHFCKNQVIDSVISYSLYVYLFTYTSSVTAISDQYTSLPHQTGYVNAHRQISD